MRVEQMRQEVALVYDSPAWKLRVLKMSDNQIVAIYMRLKLQGRIR